MDRSLYVWQTGRPTRGGGGGTLYNGLYMYVDSCGKTLPERETFFHKTMYAFVTRIGAQICWNSIPYSIKILKR